MRLGDTIEASVWLDGTETDTQREAYIRDVTEAIDELCEHEGFVHGPVRTLTLHPLDDRVPEVPDHIQGPDVMLFVVEADVIAPVERVRENSFLGDLEPKDLDMLRFLTRRQHRRDRPYEAGLTDEQCDRIIEEIGPDAAMDAVRKAVNGGTLH